MYILGFVAEGFGNKIYMLTYYIHIFFKIKKYKKLNKLYLVSYTSHHEKDLEEEKIYNIFPLLKNQDWLEWIDWNKYIELKKNVKNKISNRVIKNYEKIKLPLLFRGFIFNKKYFFQSKDFFNKLYQFDSSFSRLDSKYDFNQIAVHIRLGDKIKFLYKNYIEENKNSPSIFTVFIPEFYTKLLNNFDLKKKVYIFTDSPKLFHQFYAPLLKHKYYLVDVNFYHAFYLMSKFKNIIVSESTMSIFSTYLNNCNDKKILGHKYSIQYWYNPKEITYYDAKIIPNNATLLTDKKYFLNENLNLLKEMYLFSKKLT